MQRIDIGELRDNILERTQGYRYGWFATINTNKVETPERKISENDIYTFTNKQLTELWKRTNRYCFGKSDNRLLIFSAIEIGKESHRLHSHSVVLHQGNVRRKSKDVGNHIIENSKRIFKLRGEDAYDVQRFNPSLGWETYFLKQTEKMFRVYGGVVNMEIH